MRSSSSSRRRWRWCRELQLPPSPPPASPEEESFFDAGGVGVRAQGALRTLA